MSEFFPCHHVACSAAQASRTARGEHGGVAPLRALVVSHRTAGLDALRQIAIGCERGMALHGSLTGAGIASVVLITCNRTEIYWHARRPDDGAMVQAMLAAAVGGPPSWIADAAATLAGAPAARHLFRVCAGLESLVLGEAEILGQVRGALDACTGAGPFLRGVVIAAIRAGRMARAETAIGVGALSVASAAVQVLAKTLSLPGARVVVVGAGDTGLKAARHLRALGVGELVIANRTLARAEHLARAVSAEAMGLDGLPGELRRADAVVCAVATPTPFILGRDLRTAAAARQGRPLVIVDLGMPPAVDAGETSGVTHVNLSALEAHVADEHGRRAQEIPKVEAVVNRELERLGAWARRHALRPIASDLRQRIEAIRRAEQELPQVAAPPLDLAQARCLQRGCALELGGQPWR